MSRRHPLSRILQLYKEKNRGAHNLTPIGEEELVTTPRHSPAIEKMGCLILAGGEGTRLGAKGPKGCVTLPWGKGETPFQRLFEKIGKKGRSLHTAVMTSPHNHVETEQYLRQNDYFGVDVEAFSIFSQQLIEMSDERGFLFCDAPGRVARAPDGNGWALHHLYRSGVWKKWLAAGIDIVQVIPIDNLLAQPFDGELLGTHEDARVELVVRCVERSDPEEKLGIVGIEGRRMRVCEYSELTDSIKWAKKGKGLRFSLGNSGLFSCSMDFVERVQKRYLPWHLVKKEGWQMVGHHHSWERKKAPVWKFETFIFDLFPHARSFRVLLSKRAECFAPLKSWGESAWLPLLRELE